MPNCIKRSFSGLVAALRSPKAPVFFIFIHLIDRIKKQTNTNTKHRQTDTHIHIISYGKIKKENFNLNSLNIAISNFSIRLCIARSSVAQNESVLLFLATSNFMALIITPTLLKYPTDHAK